MIGLKVVVYGAGISGKGAAEVFAGQGNEVVLYNDTPVQVGADLQEVLKSCGGRVQIGDFQTLLEWAELLILSPGIDPANANVQNAREHNMKVLPEIEAALDNYAGRMAAITGTNGKTTTTTLVGEMFKTLGVPTKVAGNIGLSLAKEIDGLPADAWVAAEISSFQLETTQYFTPQISCVLNLTPDHLERHHTLEAYYEAKRRICARQTGEQFTVLNYDDPVVRYWAAGLHSQVCYFSRKVELPEGVFVQNGSFVIKWRGLEQTVCEVAAMKIFGPHNVENALAAIAVGFLAGCKIGDMARVIGDFQPVEHRLEYVRTLDGVPYYNDSKATNTDSAVKALESFPQGHIVLIAGGHDKLTDLTDFMESVKHYTDELILLGEAKQRFYEAAQTQGIGHIHLVDSFEESVNLARKLAKKPQVVLLSPACSSFDMFSCFEERGEKFKALVRELR